MDTVSVEWYEVPEHTTQIWSGRREELAKAFLTLAAVDTENMTTVRDIRELVGGDINNLRKSLEQMPGVVKVLATPYKSRLTSGWYFDQRFVALAQINHPGHVYPLSINKQEVSRLATVQVKLRPIDNEAETKRIYYQHYGRQNSGKSPSSVESGPAMIKYMAATLEKQPEVFEPVQAIVMKPGTTAFYEGKPNEFTKMEAKGVIDRHSSLEAAIIEILTIIARKENSNA